MFNFVAALGGRPRTPARRAQTGHDPTMTVLDDHHDACDGLTQVVHAVGERWDAPSPCSEWDARGVLEHVIGFHDVLLLRPLASKPNRPKDDPVARWNVTVTALGTALTPDVMDAEREGLLGILATDVLIHTWDVARAIGADVTLDERLCAIGLERALAHQDQFAGSDMFGPQLDVPATATTQDRLLGLFGRDPQWSV